MNERWGETNKTKRNPLGLGGGGRNVNVGWGLGKNGTLFFLLCLYLVDGLYLFFIDAKANVANKTKQKLERTNEMKAGKAYGGEFVVG
jgi:uncharacterized membrane protein